MQRVAAWPANAVARFRAGSGRVWIARRDSATGEIENLLEVPSGAGWDFRSGDEAWVPPEAAGATFVFRDGSTLRVGGGNYLLFKAIRHFVFLPVLER